MKRAFTLSEVLITLMILGVIATVTIPALINKVEKKIQVTKIKRAYSDITNQLKYAMAQNNCTDITCVVENNGFIIDSSPSTEKNKRVMKLLLPNAQYDSTGRKCFPDELYTIKGTKYANNYNAAPFANQSQVYYCLNNMGIIVSMGSFSQTTGTMGEKYGCSGNENCMALYIFTDGKSQNAIFGRNLFYIVYNGNGSVQPDVDVTKRHITELLNAYPTNNRRFLGYLIKNGWNMDY